MAIKFGFDKAGGFIAVETVSYLGTYAYPTSPRAVEARRNPDKVAAEMIAAEAAFCGYVGRAADLSRNMYLRLIGKLAAPTVAEAHAHGQSLPCYRESLGL